jgi:hypothetical protein
MALGSIMNNNTNATSTSSGYSKTSRGGGVHNAGTFKMLDGTISGNSSTTSSGTNITINGGGLYNEGSSPYTLVGGSITGNTPTNVE